jgi:UPF0716 family protein affecting phage T7 exclusion
VAQTFYISTVAGLLLLSGGWHLFAPRLTEKWMSRTPVVRLTGVILIFFAALALLWPGWYFRALFAVLLGAGAWRLCFPHSSIRTQQRLYPRWVHGCLLTGCAILVWFLRP